VSAPFDIDVELDDEAETIPSPNANTEELALELEKLALAGLNKLRPPSFLDGWKSGVRDAAQYVSDYGKRDGRVDR